MLSNLTMPKPDELREQDFMRLLSDHKERLFRLIFCIVRSLEDADDAFQHTSIVLWNKFSEFEPGSNFYLWASTVARLTSLNVLKAKRSQRLVFSGEFMDELVENDLDESLALRDARLRALRAAARSCRRRTKPYWEPAMARGEKLLRWQRISAGRWVASMTVCLEFDERFMTAFIKS